ncbi:phospholipase [Hymenobacter amundsenii]|uniref:Phospholipase n=1 Tax=Hymenobacter amundsenii TaxID=2006685 RepID=A0A246FLY7_9BACT|nr:phospholipase [Hymenobacter amundsenii]OWP62623.1 phospholipase [Hymenobacter amundsenii]
MEHQLAVTRTARYQQLGELSGATRRLWFVAHGYGQLAAYFVRHFAHLVAADPALVVIAPEGLSRFYLNGTGGRVGATWMTKEDRLAEIDDYVAYLNQLAAAVLPHAPNAAVTVLGFSQGAATVSRWLARATFRPARLILWAGAFPPDMDFTVASHLLRGLPVTLVCGTADEFITDADLAKQQDFLRQLGVEADLIRFTGTHTLHAATLSDLAKQLHTRIME